MNALELADGILAIEERIFLTKKEHQLFQNSAAMLRTIPALQAEIEVLKDTLLRRDSYIDLLLENGEASNQVKKLEPKIRRACKKCIKQQAEIEALKELNTMLKDAIEKRIEIDKQVYNIEFLKQPMQILENGQIVPLFKELTDEEIISEWVGCERNYYNFARAILRKASEK